MLFNVGGKFCEVSLLIDARRYIDIRPVSQGALQLCHSGMDHKHT
jgi:hypothetical protein